MPPGLFVGVTDSLGERIQRGLPETKVVKCFNTVGNSQMVDPTHTDVEMLICGNDTAAKREVERILKEFGWKGAIDIGGDRWSAMVGGIGPTVGEGRNRFEQLEQCV